MNKQILKKLSAVALDVAMLRLFLYFSFIKVLLKIYKFCDTLFYADCEKIEGCVYEMC